MKRINGQNSSVDGRLLKKRRASCVGVVSRIDNPNSDCKRKTKDWTKESRIRVSYLKKNIYIYCIYSECLDLFLIGLSIAGQRNTHDDCRVTDRL